jgi:hypothetical protein
LARRIADATQFLASDAPERPNRGRAIRTFADLFRSNRKVAGPVVVTQTVVAASVAPAGKAYAHLFDLASSSAGAPFTFNPAARFVEEAEYVMELVQRIVGRALSAEQYVLAKQLGVAKAAATANPTLMALIDASRAEPSLAEFAEDLATAAIPGGLGSRVSSDFSD